jgi:HPt (histidine-containing phosphotransfer) domain-containing protein
MNLDLDLTYLNEISDGDTVFIHEVLNTFLEEMPKDMEKMQSAIDCKDHVTVGKVAHKTKSTLHTIGLHDLKSLALQIEQTAKEDPSHPEIITWAKEFVQYIEKVYPTVQSKISK